MLLVDFGERSYTFAVCKQVGQNIEVQAWGVEDMRSLEHGTESILKRTLQQSPSTSSSLSDLGVEDLSSGPKGSGQAGESADVGPTFLSFSPVWWQARTFYERIERKDAGSLISPVEKENILEDLSQRVAKKLGEEIQGASGILAEDVIIEKLRIQRRVIDGYAVPDILGLQGSHLDFQLMVIFTLVKYRPILDNVVHRFQNPSVFHLAEALRGFSEAKKQDGLYLDMGGDSTQIIVVKDQEVVCCDQVPLAGKDFTFFVQETLSLGENTAKDFKERYAAGDFSFLLRERVKKGFLNLAKELLNLIQKRLQNIPVSLPPSLFVFGGTAKLPEIQEIFQGNAFRDLPFSEKPSISFLLPKDLGNVSPFPGKTNPVLTPLFLLPYAL